MKGQPNNYPLLETLLSYHELPLKPIYTVADVAKLFEVSTRSIQAWVQTGQLTSRKLPGRGKFFPGDLEGFLEASHV